MKYADCGRFGAFSSFRKGFLESLSLASWTSTWCAAHSGVFLYFSDALSYFAFAAAALSWYFFFAASLSSFHMSPRIFDISVIGASGFVFLTLSRLSLIHMKYAVAGRLGALTSLTLTILKGKVDLTRTII